MSGSVLPIRVLMKNGRLIRLALVDNDRCSAEMMALLIGRTIPEAHMLWVTDNPSLALERCLFDPRKPDILICDLMMDGLNGVRLTERIRQRNVQVGVIVVTSYDLATYGEDIACCGAQALISKRDFAATIREAVKSVFDGGTYPHGWGLIAYGGCRTTGSGWCQALLRSRAGGVASLCTSCTDR